MDWAHVKWSESGQVLSQLGWRDEPAARAIAPSAYFARLTAEGRREDAVRFLALALPRLETVAWAAAAVRDLAPAAAPNSAEAGALKAALLWVQNPAESRRRAAFDAAQAADSVSPEAVAAMAAFYSGGSVAPENCEPLPAPREAAGRFAAGAILLAAARSDDPEATLQKALTHGEMLARQGFDGAGK